MNSAELVQIEVYLYYFHVHELKEVCDQFQLSSSGKKKDLILRLLSYFKLQLLESIGLMKDGQREILQLIRNLLLFGRRNTNHAKYRKRPKKEWAYLNFIQRYSKEHPEFSKAQVVDAWKLERNSYVQQAKTILENFFRIGRQK